MQVALSDLKLDVGRYVDMADMGDVIITKYGKPTAKIVRFNHEPWYAKQIPEEITSITQLFGTLPSDIDLDDIKTGRLAVSV